MATHCARKSLSRARGNRLGCSRCVCVCAMRARCGGVVRARGGVDGECDKRLTSFVRGVRRACGVARGGDDAGDG
jgi:hypothetical protein